MEFDSFSLSDLHHRISSPTCEDLGIPRDLGRDLTGGRPGVDSPTSASPIMRHGGGVFRSTTEAPNLEGHVLAIDGLKYELENPNNPFSPFCQIPVPNPFAAYECGFEPAFIRKRNERERERVRGVNDGYQRLRNHLPLLENKEKRISKVETLRSAIKYIRHLQGLLSDLDRPDLKQTTNGNNNKKSAGEENRQPRPEDVMTETDVNVTLKIKHPKGLTEGKSKRKALDRDD